jgi:class 3 adenylate cyclase/tetratricopeptide (TPR) repeat protein
MDYPLLNKIRDILERSEDGLSAAELQTLKGMLPANQSERLQRKQVSVIFADLSGFTAMSERLDPEEVRELLSSCFEELVDVIESHQGTVEKYIGDCIVAIFGAPLAQEDHALKALKTCLGLLTRLEDFNVKNGLELGLHIGVNSGLVVAGEIRAGSTSQYAVTGDTVNLAARLEGKSSTGEILVGPETYRLSDHLFRFGPPRPLTLKGKAEPVPARLCLGLAEAPRQALTPIFGREHALVALKRKAAKPGITEVQGSSGIGKTFLAQHLAHVLADAVVVNVDPDMASEPFSALREILDNLLPGGLAQLQQIIEQRSLDLNKEHLAPVQGNPIPGLKDAGSAQTLTRMAVTRLFIGLSETAHATLMVDDAQWLDPSSRGLLAHLSEQRLCRGFLFSRSEGQTQESEFDLLRLAPLEKSSAEAYLTTLLPDADSKLIKRLAKRSGGHPLFVRELARQARDHSDMKTLPGNLQAAVMARVDSLDSETREVLEIAATLGPEFSESELKSLCPDYQRGLESGFLKRVEEQKLSFHHKLAQESIYESLSLRRRRQLHQVIAEFLEENRASDGRLAYHFTASEDWVRAGLHLQKVADHAVSLAADKETTESFAKTLEIRKKAGGGNSDEFEVLQTERRLGEVKLRQGDLIGAREHLQRAAEFVGFKVPQGRWAVRGRLARSVFDWLLLRGSGDYPSERRRQRELFRILKALCFAEVSQPENFLLYSLEHMKVAKACGDYDGVAVAQAGFGMAFDFAGWPRLAAYYHRRALGTASRCLQNLTHALANLGAGCHFALKGRGVDARAHLQEAVVRSRQSGDLKIWSTALVELATLDTYAGALNNASEAGSELLEIGRTSGDRQCQAWGELTLGRLESYVGGLENAAEHLTRAEEMAREAEDFFSLSLIQSHLVLVHLQQDEPEAAEKILVVGEQMAVAQSLRGHLVGWLALARAEFEVHRGSPQAKLATERAISRTHHTMGGPSHALRVRAKSLWRNYQQQPALKLWDKAERVALERGELLTAALARLEKARETELGPSYANLKEALATLSTGL